MPSGKRAGKHLSCPYVGCSQTFLSAHGRTYHVRSKHEDPYYVAPAMPHSTSPAAEEENADSEELSTGNPSPSPPCPTSPKPASQAQKIKHPFLTGPFIADYPEQVMLAGIVQNWCPKCTSLPDDLDTPSGPRRHALTNELIQVFTTDQIWDGYGIDDDIVPFTCDFPRADIHELLSSDILHQVIKGTFKDHLVEWVELYIGENHTAGEAALLMDELDRRIAAVPAFPCLRRFKQGRRFKQWTGDDSKALMKVYLPAIHGLVPTEVVQALSAFLDFCYLVRQSDFTERTLEDIDKALKRYHLKREVFRTDGVRPDGFSLPRQHSLVHYRRNIEDFGAPNGLCSSITESRHITAVKKPWRRSNRYEALGQMLTINQRLDKLAASRADFISRGMLPPSRPPPLRQRLADLQYPKEDPKVDDEGGPTDEVVLGHVHVSRTRGMFLSLNAWFMALTDVLARGYSRDVHLLSTETGHNQLPNLLLFFLEDQVGRKLQDEHPFSLNPVYVHNSAVAHFYAPSDPSGLRGMRHERIRSTQSWRGTGPRRDCAFVSEDELQPGFAGMSVVRVLLIMSFTYNGVEYPCALVKWFEKVGDQPDEVTGMWVVRPEMRDDGDGGEAHLLTVVHLRSIVRGAHLIPVFGRDRVPKDFRFEWSLDAFDTFYVNKYIDHHANEIAF